MKRVLILGGYGNFGSVIAKALAEEPDIQLIIAGRSLQKAQEFVQALAATNPALAREIDIQHNIEDALTDIQPAIVIHTCGPFQHQNYDVAHACVQAGVHYIDLADGRDFVAGITSLHSEAQKAGVLVVSGASSVPCLTSALIDHYLPSFANLHSLDYGITTAQKTTRGLATTAAILGYTGKQFLTLIEGHPTAVYGWQGLKARKYQTLGWRLLGHCDIPDLTLFPIRYPSLKNIRFYAGLEIPLIHLTLWGLSWLVRVGILQHLEKYAPLMLRLSFLFDWLGSANSAFHMSLSGQDASTPRTRTINFELIARSGDGPYIPCMPALLLTKKLITQQLAARGAMPCVGLLTAEEYLNALRPMNIKWHMREYC
jgi:hypothetical protein